MMPIDSVAHKHNGKALGKRPRRAGFSSPNGKGFQPGQSHGDSSAMKESSTGWCFAHRVLSVPRVPSFLYSGGRNFIHTGEGQAAKTPDGFKRPFPASIRQARMVSES